MTNSCDSPLDVTVDIDSVFFVSRESVFAYAHTLQVMVKPPNITTINKNLGMYIEFKLDRFTINRPIGYLPNFQIFKINKL